MPTKYEKRLGSLYGIALGDAMGMPSEGMHPDDIAALFGRIDRLLHSPASLPKRMREMGRSPRDMLPGEVTDDTETSVIVAEMLIANQGKVNPTDFVHRLQAWVDRYSEKAMLVCGPSTKRALAALKDGMPLDKAGRFGDSNGSIMKVLPVGLVNDYHDMPELIEQVYQLCLPTHNTSLAVSGAAAVAAVASYAVYCDRFVWDEAWSMAIQAAELGAQKGHWCWGRTMHCALLHTKEVMDGLIARGADESQVLKVLFEDIGTGLPCAETGCAAIAIAYYADGDPRYAAILGANVGADTDTVASIAAGICGAIRGIDFIPSQERDILERVNHLKFSVLAQGLNI